VTTVLILLALPVVFFAGWFLGSRSALRKDPVAETPAPAEEELSDELIAVIAAAAAETLIAKVVVRRIQFLNDTSTGAWATTGRLNIMASHQISKRNT
jgi:hypothetical protein